MSIVRQKTRTWSTVTGLLCFLIFSCSTKSTPVQLSVVDSPVNPQASAQVRNQEAEEARLTRFYNLAHFYEVVSQIEAEKPPLVQPTRASGTTSYPTLVQTYQGSVPDLIRSVFVESPEKAVDVAYCESTFNPSARAGPNYGLMQLNKVHEERANRLGYSWAQVATEAYANLVVAHDLYLEQGWDPWACA